MPVEAWNSLGQTKVFPGQRIHSREAAELRAEEFEETRESCGGRLVEGQLPRIVGRGCLRLEERPPSWDGLVACEVMCEAAKGEVPRLQRLKPRVAGVLHQRRRTPWI